MLRSFVSMLLIFTGIITLLYSNENDTGWRLLNGYVAGFGVIYLGFMYSLKRNESINEEK